MMTSNSMVAIVGAGAAGWGWAVSFARAGCDVALYDPVAGRADVALRRASEALAALDANDLLDGQSPVLVRGRMSARHRLAEAVKDAGHVQECAPDILPIKAELFRELDRLARPDAVLASSSAALPASRFTVGLRGRARCITAHPVTPCFLIPMVEIAPTQWTEAAIVRRTQDLMRAIGQRPLVLEREVEGLIANRLQAALLNEALRLLEQGVATAVEVDDALKHGVALSWSLMGPLETIDLDAPGGVRDYLRRYGAMMRSVGAGPTHSAKLVEALEAARREQTPFGDLERRRAWRNRRLAALMAHRRSAEDEHGAQAE